MSTTIYVPPVPYRFIESNITPRVLPSIKLPLALTAVLYIYRVDGYMGYGRGLHPAGPHIIIYIRGVRTVRMQIPS